MTSSEEENQVMSEYSPELSPYDHMRPVEMEEANALERVTNIPLVANTWDALSSYYTSTKKTYPSVIPYLELAEKITTGAANIALTTTRPVVGKLAPTVNSYANRGLDKLEDMLPVIHDQPEEIVDFTKAAVTSLVSPKIDFALSVTERYVEYYLPPPEEDGDSEDDDSDSDDSDTSSYYEGEPASAKERIQVISHKVKERAYRRAMDRVHGVQKRSTETLSKLKFTVNLIQYAKENMDATRSKVMTTVSSANETIRNGVSTSQENVANVWKEIKTRSSNTAAQTFVMKRAHDLTEQLQNSCSSVLTVVTNFPQYQYLHAQALRAKESADSLAKSLSGITSVHELSSALTSTAYNQIEHVGHLLESLFNVMSDHAPISWLRRQDKSVSEEDEREFEEM